MELEELRRGRILITGATGFLGRHLARVVPHDGPGGCLAVGSQACDLTRPEAVAALFQREGPFDYVFHCAGWNGGIQYNKAYPAAIFHRNTLMALNLLEACATHQAKKVVSVVASCSYPAQEYPDADPEGRGRRDREIMAEPDFLDGPPHDSVAGHAYAKRNLQLASSFYKTQYGLNAVCVCPATLFGPEDSFDPERTKVLGGMVKQLRGRGPCGRCPGVVLGQRPTAPGIPLCRGRRPVGAPRHASL